MARYSVAEAKNNLPKLLDKALAGEEVTITRRGQPIAQIVPSRQAGVAEHPIDPPKSAYDVEWIRRHRVTPKDHLNPEFASDKIIRRMRDEGY
jgi:prevent-host-death family protein